MSMVKHLQAVVLALAKHFISKITRVNVGENVYCWITTRNKKVLYFAFATSLTSFLKKNLRQSNRPFQNRGVF